MMDNEIFDEFIKQLDLAIEACKNKNKKEALKHTNNAQFIFEHFP